jgi:hypothetical protein
MIRIALLVAASFLAAACSRSPEPFAASRTKAVTATVQAVSQSDRHLVLQTTDGRRLLIAAPSDVRNFDQIHQGDQVTLTYHEGFIADVVRGRQEAQGRQTTMAQGRTPQGEVPAGAIGKTIETTVRIDAVNEAADTVTFTRPDGISRTLTVENPDAMRFVERLSPGDQVEISYREAAAVSIQPKAR